MILCGRGWWAAIQKDQCWTSNPSAEVSEQRCKKQEEAGGYARLWQTLAALSPPKSLSLTSQWGQHCCHSHLNCSKGVLLLRAQRSLQLAWLTGHLAQELNPHEQSPDLMLPELGS